MDNDSIQRIDPHLLVGIVNTKLRNDHADLEDLCSSLDLDREQLVKRLEQADYQYRADQNQFR